MKLVLSLLLFAGVALGYSPSYYGWAPSKEYVYEFETQMLTGIPEIRSQYSGLKLSSKVRIQSFPDYSLRVQFVEPKFVTVNQEIPSIDGRLYVPSTHSEELPKAIYGPLVTPFEVHFKRGVIESLFVEKDEPVVVTNWKKALLSQIQTDLSGSREGHVQKLNHEVFPLVAKDSQEMKNVSFFHTMERTLHGDCETTYTLHPLPLYQAHELEEQWRNHKIKVFETVPEYFQSIRSQKEIHEVMEESGRACTGKQYFQVTKTHNFDNCRERPVFSAWSGIKSNCDVTRSGCDDAFNSIVSTRYIICGTPDLFVIRKATTENIISLSPTGFNTPEKLTSFSTVTLELRTILSTVSHQIPKPKTPKTVGNLFMEYPEHESFNSESISEQWTKGSIISPTNISGFTGFKSLSGFYPIHPMPTMDTAPTLLYPISLSKPELIRDVQEMMSKIVRETYEVPESCSSSSDLAGYIVSIAEALRPLSLTELKELDTEVHRFMEVRDKEAILTSQYLFYDILAMVGTNPSISYIKQLIGSDKIPIQYAPDVLESALRNIKTPTPELFNLVFTMVKTLKAKSPQLYYVSTVSFSDLLHRACINPSSMVAQFPVHVYGNFCNPETPFIKDQYITFLESQIQGGSQGSKSEKVVLINALGKLGHYKAVSTLVKVIQGKVSQEPMIRSLAVYALKRTAMQYPAKVKPILMSIINNPGEHPEVRIAAVSVLPFSSPSTTELQKIALRTWFEPSKQVTSFIYSTLKSLRTTQVPELMQFRNKVKSVIPMVRRTHSGIQFSHNIHMSTFLDYLKIVANNKLEIVNTPESMLPAKISFSEDWINRSMRIKGLSFSLYSQGMDYVFEKMMTHLGLKESPSPIVTSELQKITQKLQITPRTLQEPELNLKIKFMGLERIFSLDSKFYMETIQKVTEKLRSSPQILSHGLPFKYTKTRNFVDVQSVAPTASGFPVRIQSVAPMVYSVKGYTSGNFSSNVPSVQHEVSFNHSARVKITPILHAKVETTMGVISPFTKQYIGSGFEMGLHSSTPLDVKVSVNSLGQLKLTMKSPEEVQNEVELAHVYTKPFTFKKSYETIVPASRSPGNKMILSGTILKKFTFNPTKSTVGIDAPLKISTDYPVMDLAVAYKKFSNAPNPMAILKAMTIPSTLRYVSFNLKFNPTTSTTKELRTRFSLASGYKPAPSEFIRYMLPRGYTQETEIMKMCREHRPHDITGCIQSQTKSLHAASEVSNEARSLCLEHVRINMFPIKSQSIFDQEMQNCIKSVKICESVRFVCSQSSTNTVNPNTCEEKERSCIYRQINLIKLNTVLHNLQTGTGVSVTVDASLNSPYEMRTYSTILALGASTSQHHEIRGYVNAEIKSHELPAHVLIADSKSRLPSISSRWNLEQMINDEITMEHDMVIYYGKRTSPRDGMHKIILEAFATKSNGLRKSIVESPEYILCNKEIGEGRTLAPVCEKLRHLSASVDTFKIRTKFPMRQTSSTYAKSYIRNVLETVFFPYLTERYFDATSAVEGIKKDETLLEAFVSREGDLAHIKYKEHGFEWDVSNIRLPKTLTQHILPLSFRNHQLTTGSRFIQKFTSQQSPASCTVEPNFVTTFDNKTYPYTLNDCEHLIVKDCSGLWPMAVTARKAGSQMEVKMIVGKHVVVMSPLQSSVINNITVNGIHIPLVEGGLYRYIEPVNESSGSSIPPSSTPGPLLSSLGPISTEGRTVIKFWSYLDGTVVVKHIKTGLIVIFDGERIEVNPPAFLSSKACGICGDMNGESSADLASPKMCIFEQPRMAAYSYMIKESCQGIPTPEEKTKFEKESHECVLKKISVTPLEDLITRLIKVRSGPLGIISKHLIEYRANGNEICFSQRVLDICGGRSVPVIGHMASTPFTCLQSYSHLAKHLKERVVANEEIPELMKYPTTYNRMIEEASNCQSSSSSGSGMGGGSLPSSPSSSDSSSHHAQPSTGRFQPQIYNY
uniref:Uncharacterized protein n=1 Tax=Lepeophtheirus salmonis TaxID=72036 RepID=A0A0K2UPJ9_LEPSM